MARVSPSSATVHAKLDIWSEICDYFDAVSRALHQNDAIEGKLAYIYEGYIRSEFRAHAPWTRLHSWHGDEVTNPYSHWHRANAADRVDGIIDDVIYTMWQYIIHLRLVLTEEGTIQMEKALKDKFKDLERRFKRATGIHSPEPRSESESDEENEVMQ